MKTCRKCNRLLPLDAFHKRTSAKDGHQPNCKPCQIAWVQATSDPERILEYAKRYRDAFIAPGRRTIGRPRSDTPYRERNRLACRRYYYKNRTALLAKSAEYRRKYPERVRAAQLRWQARKEHPNV